MSLDMSNLALSSTVSYRSHEGSQTYPFAWSAHAGNELRLLTCLLSQDGPDRHVRASEVLLDNLEDGLSVEFEENDLQCLARARYNSVRKLKEATLADLVGTGLPAAAAQLILNASAPGAVQPWTLAELSSMSWRDLEWYTCCLSCKTVMALLKVSQSSPSDTRPL